MSEIVICSWSLTLFTSCVEMNEKGWLRWLTRRQGFLRRSRLPLYHMLIDHRSIVFEPLVEQTSPQLWCRYIHEVRIFCIQVLLNTHTFLATSHQVGSSDFIHTHHEITKDPVSLASLNSHAHETVFWSACVFIESTQEQFSQTHIKPYLKLRTSERFASWLYLFGQNSPQIPVSTHTVFEGILNPLMSHTLVSNSALSFSSI